MVSINDQDFRVSFMLMLKYSFTNQNPPSLKWEKIRLPEPIDRTIKLGSTTPEATMGAVIPAVVKPATVADPTQILIIAAIIQPKNKGCRFSSCRLLAMVLLTPLSI